MIVGIVDCVDVLPFSLGNCCHAENLLLLMNQLMPVGCLERISYNNQVCNE